MTTEDVELHPSSGWFVSIAYELPARPYRAEGRRPHGVRHARRPGDRLTACGYVALTWRLFWELQFNPAADDVCEQCARSVMSGVTNDGQVARFLG